MKCEVGVLNGNKKIKNKLFFICIFIYNDDRLLQKIFKI